MKLQKLPRRTLTRRALLADASLLGGGLLLPAPLRSQAIARDPPGGMRGVPADAPLPQDGKNPYDYTGLSGAGYPITAASKHGGGAQAALG